jgi:DNA-directed RNA polymerase specialized sigma24 family protein
VVPIQADLRGEVFVITTIRFDRGREKGDVLSAAFEGLDSAIRTYDKEKNDSFRAWAVAKIKWAILDFVRREIHENRVAQRAQIKLVRPVKRKYAIEPRRLSGERPDAAAHCQNQRCQHPAFHHHPVMGCMYWSSLLPGSGWCQCDGFCVSIPIGQRTAI